MADWLILKKTEGQTGAESWTVAHIGRNKTADVAGATEALREAYTGPARYGVLRADNARTVLVEADPSITDDPTPQW